MGKIRKNEAGFSVVEILVLLLVVVLIGVVGSFVYNSNHNKTTASLTTTAATKSATTAPTKTTTPTVDPYNGWKLYCDAATGNCFKYPSDWGDASSLDAQGVKAFIQNKAATVNVEYSEPVDGTGGLGSYVTSSLNSLKIANSSYKVVGGYYTVGNIPGYNLVDTSLVEQYSLAAGKTSTISSNNDLLFTKATNKATLTVHYNNTTGSSSISASQANDWFNSADGKTALLIAQSYYNQ